MFVKGERGRRYWELVRLLQNDSRIDTTEPERIAERVLDTLLTPRVRDVVEIAGRVRLVEVQCRGQPAALEGQSGNRDLERAGRAECVSIVALRAADLELVGVVSEYQT